MELGRPADALPQYEASIAKEPNRFRGMYGAGLAAERAGDRARARGHFEKLVDLCAESDATGLSWRTPPDAGTTVRRPGGRERGGDVHAPQAMVDRHAARGRCAPAQPRRAGGGK